MHRRDFLRAAVATALTASAGGLTLMTRIAHAGEFAPADGRVLVKLMLAGGPDMRHLLPPAWDDAPGSFGTGFWRAKAGAHNTADTSTALAERWQTDYHAVAGPDVAFGIHRLAGWLKTMWDDGNVAIVNNVIGGDTRDHAHCINIIDQGERAMGPNDAFGSGWGGRLATAVNANVVALTQYPRSFCYSVGSDAADFDTDRMIAAPDTRQISLYEPDVGDLTSAQAMIARGLKGYYAAKRDAPYTHAVYGRFLDTERKLREFGEAIDERLAGIPVPPTLDALAGGELSGPGFGLQLRSLHDALACRDILDMRVASLDYNGWDSHEGQVDLIEPKIEDIFGTDKGLDRLWQTLPPDVRANLVLVVAGEFGRQLRANGDNGTDHGRGNSVLLIGESVNGGVYGDMFPQSELARLTDASPDIEGLTAIDHVFGAACDWLTPGAGDQVFAGRTSAPIETGLDAAQLIAG